MMMKKDIVNISAKFAVAFELSSGNIVPESDFKPRHYTPLKVKCRPESPISIRVGGKRGREWPNYKGIHGEGSFLVLVDFTDIGSYDRPDFYVLSVQDWLDFVKGEIERHPHKKSSLMKEIALYTQKKLTTEGNLTEALGYDHSK